MEPTASAAVTRRRVVLGASMIGIMIIDGAVRRRRRGSPRGSRRLTRRRPLLLASSTAMRSRRSHLLLAAGLATAMVGCGSDEPTGDASRFCGEIDANRAALTTPRLEFSDDIGPLLELYRDIGEFAPLAIEAEWDQLTLNYETASTVVPDDDASLQRAVATAYESEQSAAAVNRWLQENCGITLAPLTTLVPHDR